MSKVIGKANKVVIIGGVAGGASCAARLRRLDEHTEIVMVERGPHISFANCGLPYHIGGTIAERDDLFVITKEEFSSRFKVHVKTLTEAVSIDKDNNTIVLRDLNTDAEWRESFDALVLSPGAAPIRPAIDGIELPGVHVLRNIPDVDQILVHLSSKQTKKVAVVGAGFVGIETAENLIHRGLEVTLIQKAPNVMPILDPEIGQVLAQKMKDNGIELRLSQEVTSIRKTNERLRLELLPSETLDVDAVIFSIGVTPEISLAKSAGLEVGRGGGIVVNRQMRTSHPRIYAVGDAVEVPDRITGAHVRMPLAGPANRQGRLVADVISGRTSEYPGALGTCIIKVFDSVAGSTGLSEARAIVNNVPHKVAWIHGKSNAGYYPGAESMILKSIFSPYDGRLLGAQIVGGSGVDKRIDVLATAITSKMSVFDLEWLDLAYAPPFSSAKDPVNHLGTVSAGILRADQKTWKWSELEQITQSGACLLDVRSESEFSEETIPGAINIPLNHLRRNINRLPKGRSIAVFCKEGVRGYIATRLLEQNGYLASNLLGGYNLWKITSDMTR